MNKYDYALKSIAYLLVLGLLLGNSSLFAQSVVWTGNVDSDWANPANWQPNEVPVKGYTATVTGSPLGGNFPVYAGAPVIDYTVQNFGTITFNSFIYNEGTIINFNGGKMISNNFFANAGEVFYNNDGQFDNNGIFENFGRFRNTAAAVFNNATGAAVNNYGSFTNFGPVNNDGFWGNFGAMFSSGSFRNFGTIDNRSTFDNGFGSQFSNEQSATINNISGQFSIDGVFRNNGQARINNSAELSMLTASDVDNQSTIVNDGIIRNSSKSLVNNSTINNNGEWVNEDASNFENNSLFANNGAVENAACARWIQNATQTVSGTFLNEGGLVYEINGQVNVSGGEFGYEFSDLSQTAPPVPGCRAGVVVQLDENGQGSLQIDDIDKGAYGNCGAQIVNRTITPSTFTTADLGSQAVVLFVEDEFGLSATCEAVVEVLEFVPPITAVDDPNIDLNCPSDITVQTAPGATFAAANWVEPTGSSSCNTNTGGGNGQPICPGLVQNSGFEDGLTGYNNWRNTTIRTDLSDVYAGSKAAKIGSHNGGFGQTIENIQPGVEYTFSAYAERTRDQSEWTGIGINFYDSNWNRISGKTTQITATSFEQYVVKSVAPSNAVKAIIYAWKNGDSGRVYLDELCFYGGNGEPSCAPDHIDGFVYMGEFNGSRYYCSQSSQVSYHDATAAAQAAGGHLVTINNEAENEFIQSTIQYHSAWIGYTNQGRHTNDFYWQSGSSSYVNWKYGEPNEYSHDVAARILKENGQWTDRKIDNLYEFVMEIECNTVVEGPQVCDLQNFGPSRTGQGDRLVWIRFDDTNSPIEYPVQAGASFTEFANGTATLTGRIDEFSGNGGYDFSVRLINKRNWTEWSALGRSFKLGTNNVDRHTEWDYYEVDNNNSSFTGFGVNAGQNLTITHMPSDFEFGFQVGFGANDKDDDFGLSGWYTISGDKTGRGDFNADLGNCRPNDNTGGNGDNAITIEQIAGLSNGDNFTAGTTQVAYRATDACGNEEICVFDVIVEQVPSEIQITDCPTDIVVDAAPGAASAIVDFTIPTGTSNCFSNSGVSVKAANEDFNSGSAFPVGTTFLGYILTDSCGTSTSCTFAVTVNATAPTLTLTSCPEDITSDGNVVSWAEPTASSTCFTGLLKIEQTEGPANGSAFPSGTTRVSYLIADECDNTEVCFFNVTVTGDTGCATPNITLLNVPTDVSVACDAIPVVANVTTQGGCGTVNVDFIEEMVGDNCAGTITRTWTATDSEGNSSTASQTISISDTTAPVLSGVPADVTHPKGQPLPTAPQVTATDNCDNNVVITFDEVTGSDVVTRTWTAVDNCGNIVEATQTITLIDDNSCPAAGTPCDDNDPNTENDVQDGNCNCNGTPIQTVCDLGFNISAVTCNNNGTQTEPNDDQFTFDLVVFNPAGGTGYTVDGVSYEYGVTYTFGNYPIANGAATIVVYDIDNSGCSDVVTVDAPAPCTTACDITASAANVVCNDNGTPSDPSDDTFTFDLTVTGVGNPWAFMVGSEVYDYDVAHPFGPFLIANGDINLVVVDKDNPTCTDEIRISAPATCSDQPVQNCNKEVLFVVGRLNLNSGDRAAKERLEHLGLNVTLVDDDFSQTSDANGKGLIVVSSTVSSGRVKAKYRDLAIPFVTWEAWLFDDMKMTGTGSYTNYGKYNSSHSLDIVAPNHPIANGLSGHVAVYPHAKKLSWGVPSDDATVIATVPHRPHLATIFAYETGDHLVNGTAAPARRVGLWLINSSPVNLTHEGEQLFDNAILYALGCDDIQTLATAPSNPMTTATSVQEATIAPVTTTTTTPTPQFDNSRTEATTTVTALDIKVFPNPTTDFVNVDLSMFMEQAVEIRIIDQSGRIVQLVQTETATGTHRIDLNHLPTGLYFVQAQSGAQIKMKKLMVE